MERGIERIERRARKGYRWGKSGEIMKEITFFCHFIRPYLACSPCPFDLTFHTNCGFGVVVCAIPTCHANKACLMKLN